MKMKRVLVMGATGRIGRALRTFWPVHARQIAPLWQSRAATAEQGWVSLNPLAEPDRLARLSEGCDAILCLSGVTPVRGGDFATNVTLAEAAIHAGAAAGAPVLLASSAAVYGNQPGALTEQTRPKPVADYGRSKAEMEARGAELAAELNVPVCSLRLGNLAGVDAILGGWKPGFQLDLFDDGRTPCRSYIGLETLARVLADLVTTTGLPPLLNVAAPGVIEMGALLDAAGLDWTPRAAPPDAIPEVHLSTDALGGFTRFDATDSLPETMVRQWRRLTPQ